MNDRDALEQAMTQVWRKLFEVDRIQLDDNFFELGGDSALGMKLLESLDTDLNVQIPLVTVFQAPTIRELVQAISESGRV